MTVRVTTLPNGFRIVSHHMPAVESVSAGVWVGTGTRAEPLAINGVAHFLEHMAFKGTTTRTAMDIAEEIEAVGGHLNAYTSRESTAYYVKVLREHVPLAVNILADILRNPVFDPEEVERERTVILQEIGQAHDTPDDIVFDHFQERAFAGQSMGWPVLGTQKTVQTMPRDAIAGFMAERYTAGNMVLAAAGAVDHDALVALAEEGFADLPASAPAAMEAASYTGGDYREERDCEQLHLIMGFEGLGQGDDDRYAASVLANLLGGGMSSRLFQEVREKRGLVYSIYAFAQSFSDSGIFGIYAGTGPEAVAELLPVVCEQIRDVCNDVSDEELDRARAQLKSSLLMSLESTGNRADQLGSQMLAYGRVLPLEELVRELEAVDRAAVHRVAGRIFATPPTLAALGPLAHLEPADALRARL